MAKHGHGSRCSFLSKKAAITGRLFVLPLLLSTTCTEYPNNNPHDSAYPGDYRLTAAFADASDTLSVFTPYTILYADAGTDRFQSIEPAAPPGVMDTALYRRTRTDSTMIAYFTAPFTGSIRVVGTRPNRGMVDVELPVTVANPFSVTGRDSAAAGDTVTLSVSGHDADSLLTGRWMVDDTPPPGDALTSPCRVHSDTPAVRSVFALVDDTLGNTVSTDTVAVVFHAAQPTIAFPSGVLDPPVNQEIGLTVSAANADSIHWTIKGLAIDTTTAGVLHVTFSAGRPDTVIAYAVSRHGPRSEPDTLYVNPVEYAYTLEIDDSSFPDTIRARRWAAWEVSVTADGAPVTGANVTYEWSTAPDGVADSMEQSGAGNRLRLYLADSTAPFVLSVRALIGSDSTYRYQQQVVVRLFRPQVAFVTTCDETVGTRAPVSFAVEAGDPNGTVEEISWAVLDASGDTARAERGAATTLEHAFALPGTYTVLARAIDDDGLVSAPAACGVTVVSASPVVTGVDVSPSPVYVNDTATLTARVAESSTGAAVETLFWDFDGDTGSWDHQGPEMSLDTVFGSAGSRSFVVKCVDSLGNHSAPHTDTLEVGLGRPVSDSITYDLAVVYVSAAVTVTVHGRDPNGTVAWWHVSFDGGQSFTRHDTASFDTVLADSGTRAVRFYVVDDNGLVSDTGRDSLYVNPGIPVVTGVSVDTTGDNVFVNDRRRYTVHAADESGAVDSFRIDYDGDDMFDFWGKAGVDTFSHAFAVADSGSRRLRVAVVDRDGMVSAPYDTTITVHAGAPGISAAAPDTVWVLDHTPFTVSAVDPNGEVAVLYVSWDGDESPEDSIVAPPGGGTVDTSFRHGFPPASVGTTTPRLWARDEDGVLSAPQDIAVFVKLGRPAIEGVVPETVWVNDDNDYELLHSDPNGSIDSLRISFDNGTSWQDTTSGMFSHAWDTGQSGPRRVIAAVMDDDSLWAVDTFEVMVRLGRPVLSLASFGDSIQIVPGEGGALDTMFYVYKGGFTTMAVNDSDENGQCVEFYWDLDNDGLPVTNSAPYYTAELQKNVLRELKVWCKDDDSMKSEPLYCWVYPDAPPDTPSVSFLTPSQPLIDIRFSKLDFKDDSLTQFAIVLGNTSENLTDTLINYAAANSSTFAKAGAWMSYTFHPQSVGYNSDFYFHVLSKDARGSVVRKKEATLVIYPYW